MVCFDRLKKICSLCLVLALVLFCAAGTAFCDEQGEEFDVAIHTANSLGLMRGYPDGSFYPDRPVSRGQMAKILYVLLTGEETAPEASGGFSDTSGHWAEGYIAYGAEKGLISGRSDGTFAPDDPVSVFEAAKLLLAAAGYDPAVSGFVGAEWEKAVDAVAAKTGLWNELMAYPAAKCLRRDAARLLYNALALRTVVWSDKGEGYIPSEGGECLGALALDLIAAEGTIFEADGTSFTLQGEKSYSSVAFSIVNDDYSRYEGLKARVLYRDYGGVYVVFPLEEASEEESAPRGEIDKSVTYFYGYVEDGGDYYLTGADRSTIAWFTLWDGTQSVEVHADYEELLEAYRKYVDGEAQTVDFSAMPIVRFRHLGDNEVRLVGLPTENTGYRAVCVWSEEEGVVTFYGEDTEHTVDENVQIFTIDFDKKEPVAARSPSVALAADAKGSRYINAYVIFDNHKDADQDKTDGELLVIVAAANGKIYDEAGKARIYSSAS